MQRGCADHMMRSEVDYEAESVHTAIELDEDTGDGRASRHIDGIRQNFIPVLFSISFNELGR